MLYLSLLADTFTVTGPIFILVLLGMALMRLGFIDDDFVTTSSRLVFSLCLPVLLFTTVSGIDMAQTLAPSILLFSALAAVLTFFISWLVAIWLVQPRDDRGVFVQASFRSNLGVVGLALCANAYGLQGLALASLLIATLTILYNILSVVVLAYYNPHRVISWGGVLKDIATNPLIVAIVLALVFNAWQVRLPGFLLSTGTYLGGLALPLALLGTGASMNLKALRHSSLVTLLCLFLKTAALPVLVTWLAWLQGYRQMELGVLFLLFMSPTATASFIMVKSMGGNQALAANLIMTTTLVSLFTASLGLFVLQLLGLA
ncbi:MAG: putative permease [Candidatus Pseudothioglobus sp.]